MDTKKQITELISEIKTLGANMCNMYLNLDYRNNIDKCQDYLNQQFDEQYRLLDALDTIIGSIEKNTTEIQPQVIDKNTDWHFVKDGELPPTQQNFLFYTKSGLVFEGFRETQDTSKPYVKDGKIAFEKYHGNGKCFRYQFRDWINMDRIVAWKEIPMPTETRSK